MSGAVTGPPPCDFCAGTPAVVYCRADAARLCLPCDRHVHGANTVSARHARAPLCAACFASAARRAGGGRSLCGGCDSLEERDRDGAPPHDDHRGALEGYVGCPSTGDLAAILGVVGGGCETAAGDGWWPAAWEMLRLEDVIVPTASCRGLQPHVTPSSPKDRSAGGKPDDEVIIRQLGDLAKAEAAAGHAEVEPAADEEQQLPSWASSDRATGHGGFEAFNPEEAASMAVPSCEHEAWIAWRSVVGAHEPAPAPSSSAEPCLSSFVEISRICPSMSNGGGNVADNNKHDDGGAANTPPAKKGGYDVAYPDRGTVISRYREKRKNRRFGKQIRYESRKARADGRLRIKGRFARADDDEI